MGTSTTIESEIRTALEALMKTTAMQVVYRPDIRKAFIGVGDDEGNYLQDMYSEQPIRMINLC